jgi:hypothetical protein
MNGPSYPAAHAVAPRIHEVFTRHFAAAGAASAGPHPLLPDPDVIAAVIDAAFWASLRRVEGYVPKISIALLAPEHTTHPVSFEQPLLLTPGALVKVAPAVERPGIHLAVWSDTGGSTLRVWGTTRVVPSYCFVLEVAAPGLLVIKHHRGDLGKYANVAVIEGDQVKVIDERASALPDCPSLLTSLLAFEPHGGPGGGVNVLVQLAVSMRAHGRGGTLLVVPAGNEAWRASIVRPITYAVVPPFSELADLVVNAPGHYSDRGWQDALEDAVAAIGGLTAVDGATIISDRYDLLAFGAKISRRDGCPMVEQVLVTEPIEGSSGEVIHPTALGGTRHLSGAQFVQDQREGLAMVASQDGHFTVFAWSDCENMVHAHRVETLLL